MSSTFATSAGDGSEVHHNADRHCRSTAHHALDLLMSKRGGNKVKRPVKPPMANKGPKGK